MELQNPDLLRSQAYIDGKWVEADNGATFPVNNPATGEELARVPKMRTAETRRALEAADNALVGWRAKTAKERAGIMRRYYELLLAHQKDLALLMTLEQGKPLAEAMGEVAYAASFVEWFGEEAKRVYGDVIPQPTNDKRIVVTKQPIGVCVGITPWNFPAAMITRKAAPAIAAGCTMVIKPAEQTPLTALALAKIAEEAGFPPGVISVVTGDEDDAPHIGGEMTSNPIVKKLGFTGSTQVGKLLMKQCADTVKKVSLELGGNAPLIVYEDADLDEAVNGTMIAKFRNSGQVCIAANRILVQDRVYDAFAEKLVERVKSLKVAGGLEEGAQVGPLIDEAGLDKVERHVADAQGKGAELATGGHRHNLGRTFFQPTVLTEVNQGMEMSQDETFGPVAGLARFKSEEDSIRIANDTPYGLAAYLFSRDIGRVWRASEGLEYGMVGINTGLISTEVAPFGGMKESGIGREGSHYGIDEWLEIKYLSMGGVDR